MTDSKNGLFGQILLWTGLVILVACSPTLPVAWRPQSSGKVSKRLFQ
jgi:hypothetical protein